VAGLPALVGSGPLTTGSAGSLVLSNARPSAMALLFAANDSTPIPFEGGTLCAFPIVADIPFTTNAGGGIRIAWTSWNAGLSGTTLVLQYGVLDPAAVFGVALSNAVQADVP
jgi:hypothetical protein